MAEPIKPQVAKIDNGAGGSRVAKMGKSERVDEPGGESIDRIGVIDLLAHDIKTDEVLLVMNQPRPWDSSDERLHELQERFNAYASFLLDGEFAESHPELARKRARIELRCAHMPDARAIELLGMIYDQLAFQDIKIEVIVAERRSRGCGHSKAEERQD